MLWLMILACSTSTTTELEFCEIQMDAVEPASLYPGEQAQLRARPLSSRYDTALYLRGVRAEVDELLRTDCEACDSCREEQSCDNCGTCSACEEDCASCEEVLSFKVPEISPGPAALQLFNQYGGSPTLSMLVLPAWESGEDSAGGEDSASAR